MADEPEPAIQVVDRRWWARGDTADGAAAEPFDKPTYVQELEARMAAKDEELRETLTRYRAANTEFEQARIRMRHDVAKEVERGIRAVLADLLDVVDNLDRAIETSRTGAAGTPLLQGVEMVRAQVLAAQELHHHERPPVRIFPEIVDAQDIVVGDAAGHAGFGQKPRLHLGVGAAGIGQNLHRHRAPDH